MTETVEPRTLVILDDSRDDYSTWGIRDRVENTIQIELASRGHRDPKVLCISDSSNTADEVLLPEATELLEEAGDNPFSRVVILKDLHHWFELGIDTAPLLEALQRSFAGIQTALVNFTLCPFGDGDKVVELDSFDSPKSDEFLVDQLHVPLNELTKFSSHGLRANALVKFLPQFLERLSGIWQS